MSRKSSGYIARMEADVNRQHNILMQRSRENLGQMHILAMMIAAHNVLNVGPGRAVRFLDEYIRVKAKITLDIKDEKGTSEDKRVPWKDRKGDPDYDKVKRDLAYVMTQIFGHDGWREVQGLFPLLIDYWEVAKDDVEG